LSNFRVVGLANLSAKCGISWFRLADAMLARER
jgi:hypothetical protein